MYKLRTGPLQGVVEKRVFIVDMKEKSRGERERIQSMASRLCLARRGEEREKGSVRGEEEEPAKAAKRGRLKRTLEALLAEVTGLYTNKKLGEGMLRSWRSLE